MLPRLILKLSLAIHMCVLATHALAEYPDHPIRLIVPFAPAGTVDGIARLFANEFSKYVGQTVLVENKAGSGGVLGIVAASNAPADGYTLLLGNIATASSVALYPKAGINLKLLDPITLIGRSAYVLVVRNDFPAKNLSELIALLKANPGKYNYASAGAGSAIHLAAELFKSKALVDILHIPYKGAGPALNALYSADVEMMFGSVSELKPQIITKKMRPIAVTSLGRSSALPDVPSFAESGIKDYDVPGWYGVYVPVRTPVEVLKRLREAADATLKSQGLQQLLKRYEMEPVLGGPREAGDLLETEARRWSEVVNKANITAE
ncbi:MAG: tripartite tricarboxylate transporter substrate binding protein [Betaproteobacteria bacterium]|jgi:tripartite-type tricarboxylate transporter receptor subunit TctC